MFLAVVLLLWTAAKQKAVTNSAKSNTMGKHGEGWFEKLVFEGISHLLYMSLHTLFF